ncbi:uncharacterized protein [Rutidosis leptorrhynchoides]|uniref:uncharacterized protein n=1 Tax=Rutidosis leptorrhynchoides TaxID=125765 RepID=UPI003A991CA3
MQNAGGDNGEADDSRENGEEEEEASGGERKREENVSSLGPPVDDCCPICFGDFTVPCKGNCGHWYCGSCILQYWNYSAASKPCKCPMCSCFIVNLTPEESLLGNQVEGVTKVLKDVLRYNRLFVGGISGFMQKIYELPLFVKRVFRQMMDPDRPVSFGEVRLFAIILGILYAASPFDFIPTGMFASMNNKPLFSEYMASKLNALFFGSTGGTDIVRVFDYGSFALVISLRLFGLCHQWRLNRRMRRMAAAAPPQLEE